jgi:hypothetical protein
MTQIEPEATACQDPRHAVSDNKPYANLHAFSELRMSFVIRVWFWHWRVLILARASVDKIAPFRFGGSWAVPSGGETETEV